MSVSSRRRPRRPTPRRSGGRSPAAASGRAGPPGRGRRCASGRAGPGAGRRALCARGRELGRAGPGRAAAGLSRRQPPGRLHFVGRAGGRASGEGGKAARASAAPRSGRFVSRIPVTAAAAAVGCGRRGMRSAGPPGHLRVEQRAAWRSPGPLRAYSMQPSGGWRAPDLPRRWDGNLGGLHGGFSHSCLVGGGGAGGSARTKNYRAPTDRFSGAKCYNRTVWFRQG